MTENEQWIERFTTGLLKLYIDDMDVLTQGTEHVVLKYCCESIARLIEIVSSADACFSVGSPGKPGGKSVVVSALPFSTIVVAIFSHALHEVRANSGSV